MLLSNPLLDGEAGCAGPFPGGALTVYTNSPPWVGDNANDGAFSMFVSFANLAIPAQARIVSATLRLHQGKVVGAPYAKLGALIVDHVDYGPTLDGADYFGATPITLNIGAISTTAAPGYKTLDVTAAVAADRAAYRTRSQFKVRPSILATNGDKTPDYAEFNDGGNTTGDGNVPYLVVVWTL